MRDDAGGKAERMTDLMQVIAELTNECLFRTRTGQKPNRTPDSSTLRRWAHASVSVPICPSIACTLPARINGPFTCHSGNSKQNVWSPWIPLCVNSSDASNSFVLLIRVLKEENTASRL